jgi:hypothetical protein
VEEIHKFFGPIQNKNGYNYVFNENPEFIAKVEGLWISFSKDKCSCFKNNFFRYGKKDHDGVGETQENELGYVC